MKSLDGDLRRLEPIGFGPGWGNVLEISGNQKWGESGLVFPAFFGSLFESVGEFYVFVKRVGQGGNSMA